MNDRPRETRGGESMRVLLICVILVAASLHPVWGQSAAAALRSGSSGGIPDRPLSLEDCITIALSRNPQITSSQQGVVGARASLTRARSSYYPQLSVSTVDGLTSIAGADTDTRQDLDLSSRMTLWRRGRLESVKASSAALDAAEFSYVSTIQDLVEQVAANCYQALAARELIGVAQAGVESARAHLEQVKARVALGATADVDVFPAEDDLARAELDLIDARGTLRSAFAQLKNSMGVPPVSAFDLAEAAAPEVQPTPALPDALRTGLENRPEVSAARASARASGYALAQAKIARGPVTDITGRYIQGYTEWHAGDPSWDLLLSLSWPLFDGYATRADVAAAQASAKRSEADLQRVVNQVGLEIEDALVEAESTWERLGATAKSVAAAEARLSAAEGKYQQGVGIMLEVIDARVAVTTARANQVRARYDHQVALVRLQKALGTLHGPTVGG